MRIVQFLVATYYPILFLDGLLTNPISTLVGCDMLSVKLETVASFLSGIVADTTIRMSSVIHQKEIRTLTLSIARKGCRRVHITNLRQTWERQVAIIAVMVFSAVWSIGNIIYSARVNFGLKLPPEFALTLLPFGTDAGRLGYCIADIFFALSSFYALLFVVGFGLALIEWFDMLAMEVVSVNSSPCDCCVHGCKHMKNDVWHSNRVRTDALVDEFQLVQSSFEKYGRVAGAYCAGLMGSFVLIFIEFLSAVLGSDGGISQELQELRRFGSFSIIHLLVLALFGSYMANTVI